MRKLYSTLSIALLSVSFVTVSCGHRGAESRAGETLVIDSLPEAVRNLVSAVARGDAQSFASLVSYPLERPYPLHNIDDSAAMVAYYPTLVDDSLKHVIINSSPDSWQEYGWRGWSLDGGRYLWIDESVYSIDYLSAAERRGRDKLVAREMASLAPSLRPGWEPVECMKVVDSDKVMRIDRRTERDGQPVYRLAVYPSPEAMRGEPEAIFTGYMEVEGSMQIVYYNFTGPAGVSATYMPDAPDGSDPMVEFTQPGTAERTVTVAPSYWLELLPS